VIEGADEIIINFSDGSKLKVDKVLGRDTKTDLALLKVTPKKPLASVKFGSSETLKVGDWVLAIGNPFGLGGSVTVGIISAKQRDINSGPYDDYLQTDAAINKGNSGGPLFNMNGDVIGVNTAIISPTGGSIGIGFAVPSDTAVSVIDQLRQFGETRRGWLGVRIQSVSEETAEALGIRENTGALVASIQPDSPAAQAGLRVGDVVTKFDGKDVSTMRGLPRMVAQAQVGKTVEIEVLRKSEKLTRQVMIGRLPEDDDKKAGPEKKDDGPAVTPVEGRAIVGLKVAAISDELRKKFGYDGKAKGLVVVEIDPQSAASKKNIRVGDLIVEAAQEPVATVADLQKAVEKIRKLGRKSLLLRVEDAKGDLRFIALPL
jgi:serine protease Do